MGPGLTSPVLGPISCSDDCVLFIKWLMNFFSDFSRIMGADLSGADQSLCSGSILSPSAADRPGRALRRVPPGSSDLDESTQPRLFFAGLGLCRSSFDGAELHDAGDWPVSPLSGTPLVCSLQPVVRGARRAGQNCGC